MCEWVMYMVEVGIVCRPFGGLLSKEVEGWEDNLRDVLW